MTISFCTLPGLCPYLKDRDSRMEYSYISDCDFDTNDAMVKHGFRRFGRYFSKPNCNNCQECVSIRVDAQNFKFSKSVRRTIKKNTNTSIFISDPIVDEEHLRLYKKYHKFMEKKREWKYYELDLVKYYDLYVAGYGDFGKEISYYVDKRLVGVDLIDIIKDGISSIYFYYDPDFAYLSLGKFSIYQQIYLALRLNLRWIYLGYYVKNCPSLVYKNEYKPYEGLKEYVNLDKEPIWESLER
ncbi:arginyltransferase [Campylobacter sp. RM16187]|uniref:arginyltransferase n=1 Tax=Campylobacter sp. RM16187 TaxID=1660063 RepID=UPI0021B5A373|nr:arginyltransferase [Campylobacter sp. RM16187]QKG29369.1 arginyltransferase [Campylobacter sp. RM16187]